jgi:plastocyanin
MSGKTVKLLVAVMALGLVAAACSSDDSGSGGNGSSGGSGGTGTQISIKDFAFNPAQITGTAGETITITVTNNDSTEHSFTLDDDSVSQDVEPGDTQTVEVPLPDSGTVGWHCEYHPTMTGTITVG